MHEVSTVNFYKHFIGDYARDTAHLTVTEHGAYRLMLDHYYATGKPLPADAVMLARICGAASKAEREAVARVADWFFPLNGDGCRHNKRADEELAIWESKAALNREIGKLGGRPKETKTLTQAVPTKNPDANPQRTQARSQIPEKPKTNSEAVARSAGASSLQLGEGTEIERIPLVGDKVAVICQSHVEELERLYPGVDVPQTLKEIRGWNLANPTRRKTASGIAKHINGWCAKEQNKA